MVMNGRRVDLVSKAKEHYEEMVGTKPRQIYLSQQSHDQLLLEISERDGRKHQHLFEILGMQVIIDPDCPIERVMTAKPSPAPTLF